jgi:AcrR family transcriptional regulator
MSDLGTKRGRPPAGGARDTRQAIRTEGARLMHERGYAGMSLRELAGRIGIKAGSLYSHIESKQQLLSLILNEHMEQAVAGLDEALSSVGEDPIAALRAFIRFHLTFHTGRPVEAAVCLSELRCLEEPGRTQVMRLRRAYEARLDQIIAAGIEAGVFRRADPPLARMLVLGALTSVLHWYGDDGRLDTDTIAATYGDLLMNGIVDRD